MQISDPASELNDFYAYVRRLRAMAAEQINVVKRDQLEQMACRVEGKASVFASRHQENVASRHV